MKRWLLFVCIVLVLLIAAVYLFIPSRIVVSKVVPVKCNVEAAARVLADSGRWNRWWPDGGAARGGPVSGGDGSIRAGSGSVSGSAGSVSGSGKGSVAGGSKNSVAGDSQSSAAGGSEYDRDGHPVYAYGNDRYAVLQRLLRSSAVEIDGDGLRVQSMLVATPHRGIDSCFVQWSFERRLGLNPIRRLKGYLAARRIHGDMGVILGGLRNYLETDSLLYGFTITPSRVYDTLVAETGRKLAAYPATADIYLVVQQLEGFVKGYGGRVVGHPMMNVTHDSGWYLLRVAVPVDRRGVERNGVTFHDLPGMALYLQADIHGGEWSVWHGLQQVENYISDHQKIRMAIPFLTLITDRRLEPDTAKWVTRIDYPFF
jgi:hypothetical protein